MSSLSGPLFSTPVFLVVTYREWQKFVFFSQIKASCTSLPDCATSLS